MAHEQNVDKMLIVGLIKGAVENDQVYYTKHAMERMFERDISRIMVVQCLLKGRAIRPLVYHDGFKRYECRLSHYMAGVHYNVVASISLDEPGVIVITVIDTEE